MTRDGRDGTESRPDDLAGAYDWSLAHLTRLAAAAVYELPTALVLLAEGFWISVVYTLLQVASHESTSLGPLAFAAGAAAGAIVTGRVSRRLGTQWPAVAVMLVSIAATLGWLLSPHTIEALLSGTSGSALSTHPGGWLMGLAFLRGISIAGGDRERVPTESLVAVGIPGILVAYILAASMGGTTLAAFRAEALGDTVLFVAASLIGLALVRIRWLGTASRVRWSANRAWLALLVALVAGMLLVAVPASFAVGPVVMLIVTLLPLPIFVAGLLVGFDRRLFRILISMVTFAVAAVFVMQALLSRTGGSDQGGGGRLTPQSPPDQSWLVIGGWLLLLAAVALVIGLIVLMWMHRAPATREDAAEERTIDRGPGDELRLSGWRWQRGPRSRAPRDAAEAYLASLGAMASHEDLRRSPGETPAEHVRRVRAAAAAPSRPLALLAADFELLRFAGRPLTPAEHRRALGRWESIRSAVRRRPRDGRLL